MRLSRRQLLKWAPAALALTACNPTDLTSKPVAQIALPPQINIVVPVPDQPSADRLAGRTRDYQSMNPNIQIELRPIAGMPRGPFDVEAWTGLLQGVASAAKLDAAVGWDVWAPGMIDKGILRPLDPYILDIGRPLERYFMESSVKSFRRWGRVWMLPWQAQPVMVFYNRRLFDLAGLNAPLRGWMWDDLEYMGSALTRGGDKGRQWGFDLGAGPEVLIFQNGGRLVNDPVEPTGPTLDEPANVEAFAWMERLVKYSRIAPGGSEFRGGEGRMSAFIGGQIGMRMDRMGVRAGTYVGSPASWTFPWAVVPPPGKLTRATTANYQSWGLLTSSVQLDEAWGVIRHLCTQLPAEARIDGLPAYVTLQSNPDMRRLLPEGTEQYMRALSEAVPTPPVAAANMIQQQLGNAMFRVMSGQASPVEALREAQKATIAAWPRPERPAV